MELVILVGLPGSGKSTFARSLKEEGYKVVNPDSIREKLLGNEISQDNGFLIMKTAYKQINDYLRLGEDVVYDATNIDGSSRSKLLKNIEKFDNLHIRAIVLDTPVEECIDRNSSRERVVPEKIIKKYAHIFGGDYNMLTYNISFKIPDVVLASDISKELERD